MQRPQRLYKLQKGTADSTPGDIAHDDEEQQCPVDLLQIMLGGGGPCVKMPMKPARLLTRATLAALAVFAGA